MALAGAAGKLTRWRVALALRSASRFEMENQSAQGLTSAGYDGRATIERMALAGAAGKLTRWRVALALRSASRSVEQSFFVPAQST
jgi:hypothetical protein